MFEFITRWFKKSDPKVEVKKKSGGDAVRKYVKQRYINPARLKKDKRVTFTAEDIEKAMGLGNKYPLICGALDTNKFLEFARVELIRREGAAQGSTAKWTFKVK
ncbi:MAG: hypothetical protein ACYDH2_11435 [Anaerolineaceae bacterium]|nr:hypothetical protein [Anaerolineaceae bacterium]